MKYIRKPDIVEAVRWFKDGDHPAVRMHPSSRDGLVYAVAPTMGGLSIIEPGDYLVTTLQGDLHAYKPHIFNQMYAVLEYSKNGEL